MIMNASDIARRVADPAQPSFVIAEIGSNHNCSLDIAKQMIDVAVDAGCDAAKFQIFDAAKLVPLGSYAYGVLHPLEMPRDWVPILVDYCDRAGIVFCASPFDFEAVDLLERHGGAPLIKIASPEIHDLPLIRRAAKLNVPMLISTGMATMDDIRIALDCVTETSGAPVAVLHCVSLYPAAPEHIHLRMMADIAARFSVPVGFSDHSMSAILPSAAVALGARVIEKHITLDRAMDGPDHNFALEPHDLKAMVAAIREVEAALGRTVKEPLYGVEKIELNNKAIMSKTAIAAGTVLDESMLTVKRIPGGIRPVDLDRVLGRTMKVAVPADRLITWDML